MATNEKPAVSPPHPPAVKVGNMRITQADHPHVSGGGDAKAVAVNEVAKNMSGGQDVSALVGQPTGSNQTPQAGALTQQFKAASDPHIAKKGAAQKPRIIQQP
eukprot:TRINITY_DN63235_c0_g1_i1.p1 TRINITY_DN63235_c0_g1~~TRINITY_DN63235_c0_g1_i1.p1  ORF type:complete len:117 (+),score=21.11 TRINITY_DN63235_c0_g1_i1:43-351(+)